MPAARGRLAAVLALPVLVALPALVLPAGPALADGADDAVEGGPSSNRATLVEPGSYAGRLGPSGSATAERWYQVEREYAASTVHVGAVAYLAEGSLEVSVTTEEGVDCGSDSESAPYPSGQPVGVGFSVVEPPAPAEDPAKTEDEGPDPCLGADLLVRVGGSTGNTEPVDFRLTVWEEPRPSDPDALPGPAHPDEVDHEPPDVTGAAEDLEVTGSFATAPVLTEGAYRFAARTGTTAVVRVPVEWGQQLAARVAVPALNAEMEAAGLGFTNLRLRVLNPLGDLVTDEPEGVTTSGTISSSPTALDAGTVPVRWANRVGGASAARVPGEYYVALTVDALDDGEAEVPVLLEVQARGEATGAPGYPSDGRLLGPDERGGDGPLGAFRWPLSGVLALGGAACLLLGVRRLRRG